MGRIKTAILIFIFSISLKSLSAQDSDIQLKLYKIIKGNFSNFTVDNLGNIYLVNSTNQIKKLNQNLDSVAIFNDVKKYGDVYSLDVSNPLKILVYYKDFATILQLDRFLNVVNRIDLRSQNILQVKTVAQSYDNNTWLFDELDSRLKKIDDYGNLLLESSDFRLLFTEVPDPTNMVDINGLLYLYDTKTGWTVFDYYGGLKSTYALTGWKDVQVTDNGLIGRDSVYFYSSQPKLLQMEKRKPAVSLSDVIKTNRQLHYYYFLKKDGIEIYSLP